MSINNLMLGSHYPEQDKYHLETPKDGVVMGISAGRSENAKSKDMPNEDSIGYVVLSDGSELYMVADAHDDSYASELAVSEFAGILEKNLESNPDVQKALEISAYDLDDKVRESKPMVVKDYAGDDPIKSMSTTTFIAVLKKDDKFHYISIGDSYLYKFKEDCAEKVSPKNDHADMRGWIGQNRMILLSKIENFLNVSHKTRLNEVGEEMRNYVYENPERKAAEGHEQTNVEARLGREFLLQAQEQGRIDYDSFRQIMDIGEVDLNAGESLVLVTDGIDAIKHANLLEVIAEKANQDLKIGMKTLFDIGLTWELDERIPSDNISFVAIRSDGSNKNYAAEAATVEELVDVEALMSSVGEKVRS